MCSARNLLMLYKKTNARSVERRSSLCISCLYFHRNRIKVQYTRRERLGVNLNGRPIAWSRIPHALPNRRKSMRVTFSGLEAPDFAEEVRQELEEFPVTRAMPGNNFTRVEIVKLPRMLDSAAFPTMDKQKLISMTKMVTCSEQTLRPFTTGSWLKPREEPQA